MRRLPSWLLVLAVAVTATPAFAQTNAGKNIGITAGFGIGYGAVPDGTSRKMEPTFNVGAVAVLPFSENWAFQPELKYDRRTITTGNIPTEVTYVSLPILLRSKFRGIYMVQGLSINTVVSASIFDVDFKDTLTSPDVALIIGAGKRFERWSLEGRWETGFRSLQKDLDITGVKMRTLTAVATVYLK